MKVVFEGTLEEIAAALPHLIPGCPTPQAGIPAAPASIAGSTPPRIEPAGESEASEEDDATTTYLSVQLARTCLSRRELSEEQLKVLRAIYEAHPQWVLATTLGELVGYTRRQFAGLMGAFGRRVSHTEGYDAEEGSSFFEQEWDYPEGCYRYRLPETVREALRLEGIV